MVDSGREETRVDAPTILVIEDESQLQRFLQITLSNEGYRMVQATTGQAGLDQAALIKPAVVVLDLGLPDIDGLEVARRLREWTSVPILVVSARGHEKDKIAALDAGADDYLTKPFGVGELLARIRVALRHAAGPDLESGEEPVFTVGDLRVDLARRQVFVNGTEVHLTPNEYKLLATLVQHAGKVLTHHYLLKTVWGSIRVDENHYLRVYMNQLRHKLEKDPARPRYLLTEPGVGYRLAAE